MIFFSVLGYKALILIGGIAITYMARTQFQMANLLTGIMGALPHFDNHRDYHHPVATAVPTIPLPTPSSIELPFVEQIVADDVDVEDGVDDVDDVEEEVFHAR